MSGDLFEVDTPRGLNRDTAARGAEVRAHLDRSGTSTGDSHAQPGNAGHEPAEVMGEVQRRAPIAQRAVESTGDVVAPETSATAVEVPSPVACSAPSASRARAFGGRLSPRYGWISEEQQARMDADAAELAHRRAAAGYVPIVENRRPLEGEVNCAGCDHVGDFHDEHKRGYCMHLKTSVATWHPVRCAAFVPLTREKRTKFVWKGIVYE